MQKRRFQRLDQPHQGLVMRGGNAAALARRHHGAVDHIDLGAAPRFHILQHGGFGTDGALGQTENGRPTLLNI